jgi:putative restriction endonuclease
MEMSRSTWILAENLRVRSCETSVVAADDEWAFREEVFAKLRAMLLVKKYFSRNELASIEVHGEPVRIVGTQTGIWKPKQLTAAISILTGFYPSEKARPYADGLGPDDLLRYKWRGDNPQHADNRALRSAMELGLPLVWFLGVGFEGKTQTQVFEPFLPVWLIAEEPDQQQFVVAVDEAQRALVDRGVVHVSAIERSYNLATVRRRVHQPLFRTQVLHAYQRRCAVCRLPFDQLLDAAHIKADADGGVPAVSNGLALCKIHHGAFDADILGITPEYRVVIKESVLDTFDGPTLQHALKEMHGGLLRQLPDRTVLRPDQALLDERYERFKRAG